MAFGYASSLLRRRLLGVVLRDFCARPAVLQNKDGHLSNDRLYAAQLMYVSRPIK